jgi:hypothetical protein
LKIRPVIGIWRRQSLFDERQRQFVAIVEKGQPNPLEDWPRPRFHFADHSAETMLGSFDDLQGTGIDGCD